ncbi:MAG: hypothetical protein H6835_16225 [Planctomycetes bacterium]|nr:hypothetical protein [Planctomycetota bacterium]
MTLRPAQLLLVVLPFATCLAAQEEPAAAERQRLFDEAAKRLGTVGYEVPASVKSESRTGKQVIADFEAQQDALMPRHAFALQHALFAALGLPAGDDVDEFREQTVASMARGLSAYYDPLRKVFVMLPTMTRDVAEALGGGAGPLVTHELVHAHQDARDGGLVGYFGGPDGTLDRVLARRVVIEGEAELMAVIAMAGEEKGVEGLRSALDFGVLDQMFAGETTGMLYDAGRRLALARYEAGGLDAVRGLWTVPPASGEQALHATKYGADAPAAVTVPQVGGLTAARETTLGELMTLNLLRLIGVPRLQASLAAAGWDGDLLVAFDRGDDRDVALVWRSLWDRDEDAADFAARLRQRGRGVVEVEARMVDWVFAADAELQRSVSAACGGSRAVPDPVEDDAVGTAAVEAALRARMAQTSSDGEVWRHDAVGLTVPIPDGWEVKEVNGVEMLIDPVTGRTGFALNANVMKVARGPITDLHMLLDVNQKQMEQMNLTVDRFEVVERDGVEVLEGEYHGKIGRMASMHFLLLGYLRGEQQVFVTVTSSDKLWEKHEGELRELVAGIRIAKE